MKLGILMLLFTASLMGQGATVVLHCSPATPNLSVLSLEVVLDGDKLDALLETFGGIKTRYDVTVGTNAQGNNIGYVGHFLTLHMDDWGKVADEALLEAEFPIPTVNGAFHPNITAALHCQWKP